jgi:hypothetical protein
MLGYLAACVASNGVMLGCRKSPPAREDGSERRPPDIVVTAPAEADAATSRVEPASAGESSHACFAGYRRSGQVELDLLRVGALCGPPNGMLTRQPARKLTAGSEGVAETIRLGAGDCVWALAALEPSGGFELQWVTGAQVLSSCEVDGLGWCPASGPLCPDRAAELQLSWDYSGAGSLTVQVWTRDPNATSAGKMTPSQADSGDPAIVTSSDRH